MAVWEWKVRRILMNYSELPVHFSELHACPWHPARPIRFRFGWWTSVAGLRSEHRWLATPGKSFGCKRGDLEGQLQLWKLQQDITTKKVRCDLKAMRVYGRRSPLFEYSKSFQTLVGRFSFTTNLFTSWIWVWWFGSSWNSPSKGISSSICSGDCAVPSIPQKGNWIVGPPGSLTSK